MKWLALLAVLTAGCPEDKCTPAWSAVSSDLPAAVLSIWGDAADNVYVVGGGLGVPGVKTYATHWDGTSWTPLDTAAREDSLWWVWGSPTGTDVWMVGEHGLVLRWDGTTITELTSPVDTTLWGVWGTSSTDVWIVGGDAVEPRVTLDVILHWDGQTLSAVTGIPTRDAALFKVWGASATDIWVVGTAGTLLHYDGTDWTDRSSEVTAGPSTIFTVHGCSATEVYAVGGNNVFGFDGNVWTRLDVTPGNNVNGVYCAPESVLVVGNGSVKLRFDKAAGTWIDDQFKPPQDEFHGAFIDPTGALWAAGGDFVTPASALTTRRGALAYHGCTPPPSP